MFFNGYFYFSLDVASPEGSIADIDIHLSEKAINVRKIIKEPQYMKDIPSDLHCRSYVCDGLLADTGERNNYNEKILVTIRMHDGSVIELSSAELLRTYPEQYNSAVSCLWKIINDCSVGGKILEIGSRGSTSIKFRNRLPKQWEYTGVDIKEGDNVNYVGDVHKLSSLVRGRDFDVIYSSSVFEHLAAPWLVAIECAKVLKVGGYVFTATHNTWPLHEAPWDYWRFTKFSWQSLFNERTGFRIVDATFCELTKIVPVVMGGSDRSRLPAANGGWTGTACIAQKICEPTAEWIGYIQDDQTMYPG